MHFRIVAEIVEIGSYLEGSSPLRLNYTSPIVATVEISKSRPDGQKTNDPHGAIAIASTIGELRDQQAASEISNALSKPVDGTWANFQGVPQTRMQEIYSEVDSFFKPLRELLDASVAILRWRIGESTGPSQPLRNVNQYLSLDGQTWFQISTVRRLSIQFGKAFKAVEVTDALAADVIELAGRLSEEPLGHQLFREAWNLRNTNPRSALVIGVAAAEVGLKKLIGTLVPNAQWLVDEIQSPFLGKMVRKYLRTLPVKLRFTKKSLCPPNSLVNRLERAVELRNKVVHAGESPPGREEFDEMLRAVDDFLHICDVYAGYAWAAEYISWDTLSNWKDE